jgi:hypothetical protein
MIDELKAILVKPLIKLIENAPQFTIAAGLIVALFGAVGGYPPQFRIQGGWQVGMAAMGGVIAVLGWLLLLRKIDGPPPNGRKFTVSGEHEDELAGSHKIMVLEKIGSDYWIKGYADVIGERGKKKEWIVPQVSIGGNAGLRTVIVAVVGVNAQALYEYHQKVGQVTGQFPGIPKLTNDVVECASVLVEFTP